MKNLQKKRVVLGIGGGIAAYKACWLLRELQTYGAEVRVVLTEAAGEFVSPMTLQALSGHSVRSSMFDKDAERAMSHIELARWADVLLIAPATANILAQMAHGHANDLLSTLYLATQAPSIVCPAMNRVMWEHRATKENVEILSARGVTILEPDEGEQACGEVGSGRLPEIASIMDCLEFHSLQGLLRERSVLITAGPTQEAIDPVRYLSNHSSGKMGYALAAAAVSAGARVRIVSGPVSLTPPKGAMVNQVHSALEMHSAVLDNLELGSIVIGCAAVADYRPAMTASQKIKKAKDAMQIPLVKNPDIIAEVAADARPAMVVGFAAETEKVLENAQKKRQAKQLDFIIANAVGNGKGFGHDDNEVVIIGERIQQSYARQSKRSLARLIVEFIANNLKTP